MCKVTLVKTNQYGWMDHKGNIFISIEEMCKHYSITESQLEKRISAGMTLEDSLESTEVKAVDKKQRKSTAKAVVAREKGADEEKLIKPAEMPSKTWTDFCGKKFSSKDEMCLKWNIPVEIFDRRLEQGYSMREALTNETARDFNGQIFSNEIEMCRYYGVSYATFQSRKRKGYSLKTCLTGQKYVLTETPC